MGTARGTLNSDNGPQLCLRNPPSTSPSLCPPPPFLALHNIDPISLNSSTHPLTRSTRHNEEFVLYIPGKFRESSSQHTRKQTYNHNPELKPIVRAEIATPSLTTVRLADPLLALTYEFPHGGTSLCELFAPQLHRLSRCRTMLSSDTFNMYAATYIPQTGFYSSRPCRPC